MSNSTTPSQSQVLTKLESQGVHFVLCKKSKAAITPGWQKKRPTLQAVLKHEKAGGMLGFIPGRSNLLVVDVDHFPGDEVDAGPLVKRLGVTPILIVSTRRGLHLYFRLGDRPKPVGNPKWAVDGFSGELRADNGYAICWSPAQLVEALGSLAAATPTDVELFPKPAKAHTNTTEKGFVVGNRTQPPQCPCLCCDAAGGDRSFSRTQASNSRWPSR